MVGPLSVQTLCLGMSELYPRAFRFDLAEQRFGLQPRDEIAKDARDSRWPKSQRDRSRVAHATPR